MWSSLLSYFQIMEQYFYILYIVLYAYAIVISAILIYYLKKEFELYRLFSGDKEKMRALLAKDAKRFHISIVYLMIDLSVRIFRFEGKIDIDNLNMIVRYIVEVIPHEFQLDAIEVLKYFTNETIIDVDCFRVQCLKYGNYRNFIKKGGSFEFEHGCWYGKEIAEELSLYLSKEDRLYVSYLLCRLAALDGRITAYDSGSEMNRLFYLCIDGLKVDKNDFDELVRQFTGKRDQIWYDKHFGNKKEIYPSSNLIANVFRFDIDELASLKHKVTKTSYLEQIKNMLFVSSAMMFILSVVCFIVKVNSWIGGIGLLSSIMLTFATLFIELLESAKIPVLRTDIEDHQQRKGLIFTSILSAISIFMLLFLVSSLL